MDSEIHRLLTRTLNPVIKSLNNARQEDGTPRFRVQSHRGSIRYSRKSGSDVRLTKWLDSTQNQLQDEYNDGPLDDALESLKTSYKETFRYALLTRNDKAGEILTEKAEEIDEKYEIGLRDSLDEIADTEEIEITTDLNVSDPDVNFSVRTAGNDSYLVASFQGTETIQLPVGQYEIVGEHEGIRDKTTVTAGETSTAELELHEKLRAKQEREAERRKKEAEEQAEEKSKQDEDKGYTHPVKRDEPAAKKKPDKVPTGTSKSEDHGKNTPVYQSRGLFNTLLLPFRKLKRSISRTFRRTWRFTKYTTRTTYELAKVTALVLIIGTILLAYVSPSARTHMLNGNPEGVVHDTTDLTEDAAAFVSNINVSESLSSDDFSEKETEQEIHRLVNIVRENNGLNTLEYDQELSEIASKHSQDMASRGVLSHTSSDGDEMQDRYQESGYNCNIRTGAMIYQGAENIAKTYYETSIEGGTYHSNEEEVAEGIVRQWMNSPGHRKNILQDYWRREGIGVVMGEDDTVYATQNFC